VIAGRLLRPERVVRRDIGALEGTRLAARTSRHPSGGPGRAALDRAAGLRARRRSGRLALVDRIVGLLLAVWAVVDLLQIPLILAVLGSVRLARTFGAGWRSTAFAFGGYSVWVIVTARFVPLAPSGFLLLLIGTLLAPGRGFSPERAWALGSVAGLVLFWLVPVAIAWSLGSRSRRALAQRPIA
jgi:hypothetical protein